jgi:SAM-dependent methyltransferase
VVRRDPEEVWRERIGAELDFWRSVLPERVATSPEYRARMDHSAEIDNPWLVEHLRRLDADDVSILDVGSGPITKMRKRFPGKRLTVMACDPLAREYGELLDELGIEPPVRPVAVRGEELLDVFDPGSFDVAFGHNAIDHAGDPVRVVENMVEVVRVGGFVLLAHHRREAESHRYRHLHQWNFDLDGEDFVIWRGRGRTNVTRRLAGRARVVCEDTPRGLLCSIERLR